jgi:hypothetical protein
MKGQIWSSDFGLSLFIFSVATIIAFTMLTNILQKDSYDDVRREAAAAAELLMSTGYPVYWTNSTIIRAGVSSENTLSLRKMRELHSMDVPSLRRTLRINDEFYIYLTNESGAVASMYGGCGMGTVSVASIAQNRSLPAIARINGAHPVVDQVTVAEYTTDDFFSNFTSQDVIIIEGNLSTTISRAEVALHFSNAAKRGITFVIIGDPGVPILGLRINTTNVTNLSVVAPMLNLTVGETLVVEGTYPTIEAASAPEVSEYTPVAVGEKAFYATWIYQDARVWYFASTEGTRSGEALLLHLGNVTHDMVHTSQPDCQLFVPDAKQVALYTRTLPYHDHLMTMNVLVWRNS